MNHPIINLKEAIRFQVPTKPYTMARKTWNPKTQRISARDPNHRASTLKRRIQNAAWEAIGFRKNSDPRVFRKHEAWNRIFLRVIVWIQPPKKMNAASSAIPNGDWDRFGVLVGDAIKGILFGDDRQVCRAVVDKAYCPPGCSPGFDIFVAEIESGLPEHWEKEGGRRETIGN